MTEEDNPFDESHWPLFYGGCLGCVGALKEWLVRAVAAALRKGDAQLTLDRVREHELVEARRAEMATDIVAGEQQVELTGGSREQLHRLLQMDTETASPPTSVTECERYSKIEPDDTLKSLVASLSATDERSASTTEQATYVLG